ncbi:Ldh family oxidoreductase [Alphaproteobacteria bacterium LSUCC0684]
MTTITETDLEDLVTKALTRSRTSEANARSVARALVLAEIDGKKGHGLSRVPSYAGQAQSGKVDGMAVPQSRQPRSGVLAIDAGHGFAYPAFDLLQKEAPAVAREAGIAMAGICRSHHYGVAGHHVEAMAEEGLIALLLGNTPAAMAPWGGKTPLFGTNPIAFAAPLAGRPPLVIDLATSRVARGNILTAKQKNAPIPEGWALDADGQPTTSAEAALKGSMVPMAEAKGAALALMIEILAAGLTGANFGVEATSFFEAEGPAPNTGQIMILIDPGVMADGVPERLAEFARLIEDDGARLPGGNRQARRLTARAEGLSVDDAALDAARALASGG